MREQAQELAGKDYSFETKQKQDAKDWGEKELDEAMNWSAEQVKENLKDLHGKCQGHRDLSTKPGIFYVVDERDMAVKKLNSPNMPPAEIESRIGTTRADHLIRKFSAHGIETRKEEPTKEQEKPEKKTEAKGRNPLEKTVRPGMFGAK